jgi:hypothetical protein
LGLTGRWAYVGNTTESLNNAVLLHLPERLHHGQEQLVFGLSVHLTHNCVETGLLLLVVAEQHTKVKISTGRTKSRWMMLLLVR